MNTSISAFFSLSRKFALTGSAVLSALFQWGCHNPTLLNDTWSPAGSGYENGVIATADRYANRVGIDVMKAGGNAFDAAIAAYMALAVTYPQAGNIGGGGFLVYRTAEGKTGMLDFREKAPQKSYRDMYLDKHGDVIENLSRTGALSIGVPGSVAGMEAIYERFATLPWGELIQPAIKLATDGFVLNGHQAQTLNRFQEDFRKENRIKLYLEKAGGWKAGDTLVSSALAKTLETIMKKGSAGFYEGEVADDLVNTVQAHGGIITHDDLKNYKAIWRLPVTGKFKEYKVITVPPPSSGGIALLQLLYGFEHLSGDTISHNSALYIHLLTELERRVYADRAEYLGDPDFYPVPVNKLLDPAYLNDRFCDIDPYKATPSIDIKEGVVEIIESFETTHLDVYDKYGNAVSITTTLNSYFGSKVMAEKSGFMLNNEMDDFSVKPGIPNQFGLVGSEANKIEPEKRMLSSMTPTIVLKNDSVVLITGTPGGSTIITSVFQTILNALVYKMPVQVSVNCTKTHSQWLPDLIYYSEGMLPPIRLDSLKAMGHALKGRGRLGKMKLILIDGNRMFCAADTLSGDAPGAGY